MSGPLATVRDGRGRRRGRCHGGMNSRFNVRCRRRRERGSWYGRDGWGSCHSRGHGSCDCRVNVRSRRQRGGWERLGHGSLNNGLNVGRRLRRGRSAPDDGGGQERGEYDSDADIPSQFAHSPILLAIRFRIRPAFVTRRCLASAGGMKVFMTGP